MTNKSYYTILHKDEDSAYGAYIPDLPGCFAAGDTEDEAIDNLRVSLRIYAEDLMEAGRPLPSPRSLEGLRADPDVRSAIDGDGGIFVMIPLLVAGKKRRVNVTLDPSLIAAIDEAARISGSSRSDYLATAAWRAIKSSTRAVRVKSRTRKAS